MILYNYVVDGVLSMDLVKISVLNERWEESLLILLQNQRY